MPADLVKRIDLDLLFPPFRDKLFAVLAECRELGADYFAISGYRSPAEQHALFLQRPRVTHADAWQSAHNYGLALDLCRDQDVTRAGLQPTWKLADYILLGHVAKKHGLVWGGNFKSPDAPHIQWPGYVTADDLSPWIAARAELERLPLKTALETVWKSIPLEVSP